MYPIDAGGADSMAVLNATLGACPQENSWLAVREAADHERDIKKSFKESYLGQNQAPTSKLGPS
jgi:hypothetical protein